MRLLFVRELFEQMGSHAGYDLVVDAVSKSLGARQPSVLGRECGKKVTSLGGWIARSAMRYAYGGDGYQETSARGELSAMLKAAVTRSNLIHITYLEGNYGLLRFASSFPRVPVIGTVHQPESWWRYAYASESALAKLSAVIVMSRQLAPYFESVVPGKVHFIPHGVDSEFFSPSDSSCSKSGSSRFICVGGWLRDFRWLRETIELLGRTDPSIGFDLVPGGAADNPDVRAVEGMSNVAVHRQIADEELLGLYQNARALVLPLLAGGANNAIMEAMAVGLPILSTAGTGVDDYVKDAFATLLQPGDAAALAEAIRNLSSDPLEASRMGKRARDYALKEYAWPIVAAKHIDLYRRVLKSWHKES